jgi:hypothetical protein
VAHAARAEQIDDFVCSEANAKRWSQIYAGCEPDFTNIGPLVQQEQARTRNYSRRTVSRVPGESGISSQRNASPGTTGRFWPTGLPRRTHAFVRAAEDAALRHDYLALRQQLTAMKRTTKRPCLRIHDRLFGSHWPDFGGIGA